MSTKYILVGGYAPKAPDGGRAFCEELVKGFENKPVKILCCLFAREKNLWENLLQKEKQFFSQYVQDFEMILADPAIFIEQVKMADVIFLKGGDTDQLLDMLAKSGNWINEIHGKIVAGTSAGAQVISTYYYNTDNLILKDGLGLLPIKVMVHWKSDYNASRVDWDSAYAELVNYKEELDVVTLKEGEFKVFNKE